MSLCKNIKKQFWKRKLSYSNFVCSDDDCKFGTHAGKLSAKREFFSLEVHKRRKKTFSEKFFSFNCSTNPLDTLSALLAVMPARFLKKADVCSLSVWKWWENVSGNKCFSSSCWFWPAKMHFWEARKKTFYKTRKTSSSRSVDDEKKLLFPTKSFFSIGHVESPFDTLAVKYMSESR